MNDGQPATSLRERQKAQTKAHLLGVVTSLIASKGFAATSIDDIAKAAGSSRATVYSYFESKDAILIEIMRLMWDDADEMYQEFSDLKDWSRVSVRGWVASVFDRWEQDAERNVAAVDVGKGMMLEQYEQQHARHVESLTKNAEPWQARFSLHEIKARASMLISLIETHVVNPYVPAPDDQRDARIDVMTDVWLDVLRAQK